MIGLENRTPYPFAREPVGFTARSDIAVEQHCRFDPYLRLTYFRRLGFPCLAASSGVRIFS